MGNIMRDFEAALSAIYIENYIGPSETWKSPSTKARDVKAERRRFKEKLKLSKEVLLQDVKNTYADRSLHESEKELVFRGLSGEILSKEEVSEMFFAVCGGSHGINHIMDISQAYVDLQTQLENNYFIPKEVQSQLNIGIDYHPVLLWFQRHVMWQAAAQVLAFSQGRPRIQHIMKQMLNDPYLYKLLGLKALTSVHIDPKDRGYGRELEKLIALVVPIKGERRGRPNKDEGKLLPTGEIIFIPNVYYKTSKKINFKALKLAIVVISKVLKHQAIENKVIIQHPIIRRYADLLPCGLSGLVDQWVRESLQDNCW